MIAFLQAYYRPLCIVSKAKPSTSIGKRLFAKKRPRNKVSAGTTKNAATVIAAFLDRAGRVNQL
jgi:hypothetical protein